MDGRLAPSSDEPAEGVDARLEPGLGVYIHWPFCLSKCPYCDFNSRVSVAVDPRRWQAALIRALARFADETAGQTVASVFFGGGTPSLMPPETVAALIDAVRRLWPTAPDLEISLEANPTSSEAARFAAYRDAGVNRLSIGVQALDDRALAFLGRTHSADEAREAVAAAAKRFPQFSFDLIYGRPGQTTAAWREELAEAAALAGDHLSLYQLTVEPGTAFFRRGVSDTDADVAAELYEATQEALAARGFPAYEISNHARPGGECRHNLDVWRGGDYVGVGPGAHGRLTIHDQTLALRQIRAPEAWLAAVETAGHGAAERLVLSSQERVEEVVMLGLRLTEGIGRRWFRALTGREIEEALDARGLAETIEGGFVEADARGVRATAAGRLRLNAVLARLLA